MKRLGFYVCAVIVVLGVVPQSMGSEISYALTNLGAGDWQYNYTITNTTNASGLYVFDIYFPGISSPDAFSYSSLTETANPDPSNWLTTIFPPSAPDLGAIYDAYALTTPIALNDALGGFSITFHYSGTTALGPQTFEIYDASYSLLESGTTTLSSGPVPVPEPSTLLFLGSAAPWLLGNRRRARKTY